MFYVAIFCSKKRYFQKNEVVELGRIELHDRQISGLEDQSQRQLDKPHNFSLLKVLKKPEGNICSLKISLVLVVSGFVLHQTIRPFCLQDGGLFVFLMD